MKCRLLCLCFVLFAYPSFAQLALQKVFKGKIDNREITLYLRGAINPCTADTNFTAMYHYGSNKNWIQLVVESNRKGNFCFTEVWFTGVIIATQKSTVLKGIWVSPDGNNQQKVHLELQPSTKDGLEKLEVIFEKTNYENYDC